MPIFIWMTGPEDTPSIPHPPSREMRFQVRFTLKASSDHVEGNFPSVTCVVSMFGHPSNYARPLPSFLMIYFVAEWFGLIACVTNNLLPSRQVTITQRLDKIMNHITCLESKGEMSPGIFGKVIEGFVGNNRFSWELN